MSICSTGASKLPETLKPLTVSVKKALASLDVGNTKFYELVKAGEIVTFKEGAKTLVVYSSLEGYVRRKLEASRQAA